MKDDVISRQAALDALEWKWAGKAAIDAIKNLPSAQPEIVRCRDCKHFELAYYKKDGTENFKYKRGVCCRKKRGMWVLKDWYCADGERREE